VQCPKTTPFTLQEDPRARVSLHLLSSLLKVKCLRVVPWKALKNQRLHKPRGRKNPRKVENKEGSFRTSVKGTLLVQPDRIGEGGKGAGVSHGHRNAR